MKLAAIVALILPLATALHAPPRLGARLAPRRLQHLASTAAEPPADVPPPASQLPASQVPGMYCGPYSTALGVSAAAVLCSEIIVMPGKAVTTATGALKWLGRASACTQLPLLAACLLALRSAARVGPARLRSDTYQRLNLAVAASSLLAIAGRPRPDISVIVARAGTAMLCLEVFAQTTACANGDVVCEATTAARGFLTSCASAARLGGSAVGWQLGFAALALGCAYTTPCGSRTLFRRG